MHWIRLAPMLLITLLAFAPASPAADHRAAVTPGYVNAPDELLEEYYAQELEASPVASVEELRSAQARDRLATWLSQRFSGERRLVLFVTATSEADRRFGRYFVIATAGLGDRQDDWTTAIPLAQGDVALSGVSVVHLRQTGRVGERFLRDARRGEALLGCNLHPDAVWSIDVDARRPEAEISVSLGPDAPSRMHSVFQDCRPVDAQSLGSDDS